MPMHATTWMVCSTLLCALVTGMAPPAGAQGIFKCAEGDATAYQSTPCTNGQIETRLATGAPHPPAKVETAVLLSPPARQLSRMAWPWRRTSLTLGMSDDEVLNLPGWGRPSRITRAKMPREWREEWVYGQPATGERHLHFANATLIEIIDKPPVDHFVRLTLQ